MVVETVATGAFRAAGPLAESFRMPQECPGVFVYFSFVTLTTLGYGDIMPAAEMTRNLAWLEAMTGQLYLAILIAGLVGQRVAEKVRR